MKPTEQIDKSSVLSARPKQSEIKIESLNAFLRLLKERGENLLLVVDKCSKISHQQTTQLENIQELVQKLKEAESHRKILENQIIKEYTDCRIIDDDNRGYVT